MSELAQHFANALELGAIYALIALGYTLVYGILGLINFAHGDVYMVGAFVGLATARLLGLDQHPSFLGLLSVVAASAAVCGVLGYAIERIAYRPLRASPRIDALITAIGVSLLLESGMQLIAGASPRVFPPLYEPAFGISAGGLHVGGLQIIVLFAALALMLGLRAIVFQTGLGRSMRAVAQDRTTSMLIGINADGVISATFVIGSALAGMAGVLVSLLYPRVDPYMGFLPGIKAFVAAVLGGIGSIGGAVVGSFVLSLSEELLSSVGASTYRDALAFAILILVLLFRPSGLLGKKSVEKV